MMVAACAVLMISTIAMASSDIPLDLAQRFRGAHRAVVATVVSVEPHLQRNKFGDELIVSRVRVIVEENLKGQGDSELLVDVEGGTLGGVTLSVSDLPTVAVGERAVLLVDEDATGQVTPHLRGQGILKLDVNSRVRGTSLTLGEIRTIARQAGR